MPIARFYLRQTKDPKMETLLMMSFAYNYKRIRISTGVSIQPRYWNGKEQIARQFRGFTDQADLINKKLKGKGDAIQIAYEYFKKKGKEPSEEQLIEKYSEMLTPQKEVEKPEFWTEYEKFIESSEGRVVKDVIKDYKSLRKHLKAFEKKESIKVDFDSFNFSFYQKLVKYLTYNAEKPNGERGLATNTVGKQIKNIKVFLNHCFKHEMVERFDLSNFTTLSEETDAIFLNEKEIEQIYHCDLSSQPDLEESRDLLVIGCQLGLRVTDLFRLKPEMVQDDIIRIRMNKGSNMVVIPLQAYSKEIILKYNGGFPNKIKSGNFNTDIKEIGKLANINSDFVITRKKGTTKTDTIYKKHELISSHTCRRSFCTNQFLKGVPSQLIMKISGHKTEKAFLRYLKIDEEMAAKKMMEYW